MRKGDDKLRKLVIYADGAARGNPGPAGVGVVIADGQGEVLRQLSAYIGRATNNVAEYKALLLALREAAKLQAEEIEIRLDSQLLKRQLRGEYKVKSRRLRPLYEQVQALLSPYGSVTIVHIPRQGNRQADRLANRAIKVALKGRSG